MARRKGDAGVEVTPQQILAAYRRWAFDPQTWVKEVLGWEILTDQQALFFRAIGAMVKAKYKRWQKQPMSDLEKKLSIKTGISVRAGKGRGKDAMAAATVLWMLHCWPIVKILCTAPSEKQTKHVQWSEMRKWINRINTQGKSACLLRDQYKVLGEKVFLKPFADYGYAFPKTASNKAGEEDEAKTMSGMHEDIMMLMVTEADGMTDSVLRALESTCKMDQLNIMIMIFNPTRNSGFAFKSHMDASEKMNWVRLHFDDTPNELVSDDEIEKKKKQHGEDSNYYRVRVAGNFPRSESDAIIPWEWIMDSVERNIPDDDRWIRMAGVDPAGEGRDQFITCFRRGPIVEGFYESSKLKAEHITDDLHDEFVSREVAEPLVLKNGVGIGVYHELKKKFKRTRGYYETEKPRNQAMFKTRHAEWWWKAREMFEEGMVSIPNDEEFIAELSAGKWIDERVPRQVAQKKHMKKILGHSPGKCDAFLVTMERDAMYMKQKDPNLRFRRKQDESRGWQYV